MIMEYVYRRKGLFGPRMNPTPSGTIDEAKTLQQHRLIAERIEYLERVQAQRDVRLLGNSGDQSFDQPYHS